MAFATDPLKVCAALASITPVVLPSRVTKAATRAVVSVIVTASFPNPLIPAVSYAVFNADTVPSITATVLASTVPPV